MYDKLVKSLLFMFLPNILLCQVTFKGIAKDYDGTPIKNVAIEITVNRVVGGGFQTSTYKDTTGNKGEYLLRTPWNMVFKASFQAVKSGYYYEKREFSINSKTTSYDNFYQSYVYKYDFELALNKPFKRFIDSTEARLGRRIFATSVSIDSLTNSGIEDPAKVAELEVLQAKHNNLEDSLKRVIQDLRVEVGSKISLDHYFEKINSIEEKYEAKIDTLNDEVRRLEIENASLKAANMVLSSTVDSLKEEISIRSMRAVRFKCISFNEEKLEFSFDLVDENYKPIKESRELYVVVMRLKDEKSQPSVVKNKTGKQYMKIKYEPLKRTLVSFESNQKIFVDNVFSKSGYIVVIKNKYGQVVNGQPIIYIDTLNNGCKVDESKGA